MKADINIAGLVFKTNHSWNMVKVNNRWRLIDATWAAGSVDELDNSHPKFYKDYKEVYSQLLHTAGKICFKSFPFTIEDQLLSKPAKYDVFSKGPLLTTNFLEDSIVYVLPDKALLKAKVGDTLTIRFKTNTQSAIICTRSENKKADYSNFVVQKDGWIELRYPVVVAGSYNLYVGYCDRIFF